MSKTTAYQKTLNNLYELYDLTPTLQYDAGPEGYVRLWWSELSAPPNAKAVYVIDYGNKKEKGRRFRKISNGSSVRLPGIKYSAFKEYNITVTGHLEFPGTYHHNAKFTSLFTLIITPIEVTIRYCNKTPVKK